MNNPDGTLAIDMKTQPPHERRVIEERAQAAERYEKLGAFLHLPDFELLPPAEQERLSRQYSIMRDYIGVLDERIAAFRP